MTYRKTVYSLILTALIACAVPAYAQDDEERFIVDYTMPVRTYTIADIKITGAETYEDFMLINFSGLSVGQKIQIPGKEISDVVTRFWKQKSFSDVQVLMDKTRNDSIWITIALKQLPRVSEVNFYGLRRGEIEDLEETIEIQKNEQLNADGIDRSKIAIRKYLSDKGFRNADIYIYQKPDPKIAGAVVVDINVDKRAKVKVHEIYVTGNNALTLRQIDWAMKKTNRAKNILNIFRTKKFVDKEFENDKKLLIEKYNEIGYRDAEIVYDSIAPYEEGKVDVYLTVDEGKKYYFGDVTWVGNTVYPSEYLNNVLNIEKGEVYNLKQLNKRLYEDPDAVSALYKDNGYLFMNLDPVEIGFEGDSIDIEMRLFEGKQATINNVVINGNDRLYEHVVRREMRTKPGALYSQGDLIRTLRELAQLQQFDEEKIYTGVDILPDYESGTVDIVYNLETKTSDQVEFSAGYGGAGVVLSLGLKFTNFAIQNIFKPKMYRIVPQGEGQTLSIRAQTNGVYYQNYSISFFDPWFGGKRPNSFSVSLFYSIQTGISDRYRDALNSAYNNYYYNYYNYYGYGYNYNNYYGNNAWWDAEYDPNTYARTFGAAIGMGTRLKWPDDYFTLYGELSYQRYDIKNWYSIYYGFETGVANDLSLSLNLARNSIDNPIYTRRGSSISLSVSATFPYSLVDGIDYSKASDAMRMKWVEYHKWKFNAKLFTPLTKDDKLVLMTRVEYGFLGYYNKYKRSPFGKFQVGGDGMSSYGGIGSETIGLRGYQTASLTPMSEQYGTVGYNGNIYTKLTLELRYPLLLNQSTNIWALAFLEAGNCWSDFKQFNPFDLKRAAGVGVRVYLPMFGLLGIDWGYGFDQDNQGGGIGGSKFTFVLGQEF